jgi:hypothetical protein
MWIAKPLKALAENEIKMWDEIEKDVPLSQTLDWGYAIETIPYHSVFLVFSPDEKVGGLVFSTIDPHSKNLRFECINGPYLHWDSPKDVPRQLATFAMAVSKLSPNFKSLSMKPRWENHLTSARLKTLPIPPFHQTSAATLIVPLERNKDSLFQSFSPRLKRTLSSAWKRKIKGQWEKLTTDALESFVPKMQVFGKSHGFTVPPIQWFKKLTHRAINQSSHPITFWIASSHYLDSSSSPELTSCSQVLVCMNRQKAHYLFGYEERHSELKGSISTSATAHWEAMVNCSSAGMDHYDLNGYIIDAQPSNPYYGVCRFKEQFAGTVIKYDVPEFLIE